MVSRMSDNSVDPSGNTEAFRAFTNVPSEPEPATKTPLIVGAVVAVVAVVVVIAVIVFLAI
jgi:hypothetical protein